MLPSGEVRLNVTPEYDHGAPPSLINALVYLAHEWAHKPVGFVSYGGPAGGTRAVQMVKPMMVSLKLVPLMESVMAPLFHKNIDDKGVFNASEMQESHAKAMLDALDLSDQVCGKCVQTDAYVFLTLAQNPGVAGMEAVVFGNAESGLPRHQGCGRSNSMLRRRQRLRRTEPNIVNGNDDEESQQYEEYGHDALGFARRHFENLATATLERARE